MNTNSKVKISFKHKMNKILFLLIINMLTKFNNLKI